MKVLLIWQEIPENISAYVLEGEHAAIALDAHLSYVNCDDGEAVTALNEILVEYTPINTDNPFSAEGIEKVVFSGFHL